MNKKTRVGYGGINQDLAKSRVQNDQYFDARNIKLTPIEGQTFGTLSNSFGNKLEFTVPTPVINVSSKRVQYGPKELLYTNQEIDAMPAVGGSQIIIGAVKTTKGVILFTTDDNGTDCIWEIPDIDADTYDYTLLYIRDMNFSSNNLIQGIFNYENEVIQKVYWTDGGRNYLRFINITQSVANGYEDELINEPVSSINSKNTIDISKPTVEDGKGGGVHTAGVVQYGYTLYNLNGSETSISPLSDLFPLDKGVGEGGGDVNEIVGAMPVVVIEDIDNKYDFIKVYSVKYTEYNGTPEIKLIYDGTIGNHSRFTFNDTGNISLGTLGIAEFLFLGADPLKPKHIVSKDNYLFASNNTDTAYKIDIDTRAYSFNKDGDKALIYNDVVYTGSGDIPYTGTSWDVSTLGYEVPEDFDAVNLNFDVYRYKSQGTSEVPGGPLLTNASYGISIQGNAREVVVPFSDGTLTASVSATCNTSNVIPDYTEIEFPIANGTNNRVQATTSGIYSVLIEASATINEVDIALSSETYYIQKYGSATSTVVEEEIQMSLEYGFRYAGTIEVSPGDWIRVVSKVGTHYSNVVCPYMATDNKSDLNYAGIGPYIGPSEAGQTKTGTVSLDYTFFDINKIEFAEKQYNLPLTATNGELTIVNGKYESDYVGRVNATVKVNISQSGIQQSDPNLFSLGIFKNGTLLSSQYLNLVNAGVIIRTFYFNNISINTNDVLDIRIINNKENYPGADKPNITNDIDMQIAGDLSLVKGVSGGTNGEGGTGKYISYELTRSSIDEVGIPLRTARFFKDNEIYRIGIVFFNKLGQASEAKWIADFKAPEGNLEGQYNTLKVEFNNDFYTYIDTLDEEDRPTNYSILRAIRNSTDKTIVSQGLMTGMFVQDYESDPSTSDTYEKKAAKNGGLVKTPIPLTRGYGTGGGLTNSYYPIYPTQHNKTMVRSFFNGDRPSPSNEDQDPRSKTPKDVIVDEIYRDASSDSRRQQSWQFTKLFQMHSPEATFNMPISTTDSDKLHVLGYMKRDRYEVWDYNIKTDTFGPHVQDKSKVFTADQPANFYPYSVGGYGIIGPSYRYWESGQGRPEYGSAGYNAKAPAKHARRMHVYKSFLPLVRSNSELEYEIYNKPEIAATGQSIVAYNNDPELQYTNRLTLVVSDEKRATSSGGTDAPQISSVSSEGNRCITLALGDSSLSTEDRTGLDDIYQSLSISEWDVELFGEIRKEKSFVYSGALYGGYDVSSRGRTEYISIGEVKDISAPIIEIMSPGDTFVQTFRNTRLTKAPGTTYTVNTQVIVETLEYLVETTINLEERNDTSIKRWDTLVDPTAEQGTKYNRVYSTDATLRTYTPDSLKIREVTQSETEIMASKVKIPGEFVDNWVDFQPNEVQYLDGKYGPITNVINHRDELYAFQEDAVAAIAVNPRVQTQGQDGVTIELGAGRVLHDFQYISTISGAINKWGIISTRSGIYYMDGNNKELKRIQPASGVQEVSGAKGLHSYLRKMDRASLRVDNPVLGEGVVLGYDTVNGDVFSTYLGENSFTVSFNEKLNAFTSFYDFYPSYYITRGDNFITVPQSNNKQLWSHNEGAEYQSFYGNKYESYVTLIINTDAPGADKVFNSIEYESEVMLDDVDVANSTLTSIEAWNTYQKSGKIPLVIEDNIRRKFRTWRALIPREENSMRRMRDRWLFLKLSFNPEDNEQLILHDIIINHT